MTGEPSEPASTTTTSDFPIYTQRDRDLTRGIARSATQFTEDMPKRGNAASVLERVSTLKDPRKLLRGLENVERFDKAVAGPFAKAADMGLQVGTVLQDPEVVREITAAMRRAQGMDNPVVDALDRFEQLRQQYGQEEALRRAREDAELSAILDQAGNLKKQQEARFGSSPSALSTAGSKVLEVLDAPSRQLVRRPLGAAGVLSEQGVEDMGQAVKELRENEAIDAAATPFDVLASPFVAAFEAAGTGFETAARAAGMAMAGQPGVRFPEGPPETLINPARPAPGEWLFQRALDDESIPAAQAPMPSIGGDIATAMAIDPLSYVSGGAAGAAKGTTQNIVRSQVARGLRRLGRTADEAAGLADDIVTSEIVRDLGTASGRERLRRATQAALPEEDAAAVLDYLGPTQEFVGTRQFGVQVPLGVEAGAAAGAAGRLGRRVFPGRLGEALEQAGERTQELLRPRTLSELAPISDFAGRKMVTEAEKRLARGLERLAPSSGPAGDFLRATAQGMKDASVFERGMPLLGGGRRTSEVIARITEGRGVERSLQRDYFDRYVQITREFQDIPKARREEIVQKAMDPDFVLLQQTDELGEYREIVPVFREGDEMTIGGGIRLSDHEADFVAAINDLMQVVDSYSRQYGVPIGSNYNLATGMYFPRQFDAVRGAGDVTMREARAAGGSSSRKGYYREGGVPVVTPDGQPVITDQTPLAFPAPGAGQPLGAPRQPGQASRLDPFEVLPEYLDRMARKQADTLTEGTIAREFGRAVPPEGTSFQTNEQLVKVPIEQMAEGTRRQVAGKVLDRTTTPETALAVQRALAREQKARTQLAAARAKQRRLELNGRYDQAAAEAPVVAERRQELQARVLESKDIMKAADPETAAEVAAIEKRIERVKDKIASRREDQAAREADIAELEGQISAGVTTREEARRLAEEQFSEGTVLELSDGTKTSVRNAESKVQTTQNKLQTAQNNLGRAKSPEVVEQRRERVKKLQEDLRQAKDVAKRVKNSLAQRRRARINDLIKTQEDLTVLSARAEGLRGFSEKITKEIKDLNRIMERTRAEMAELLSQSAYQVERMVPNQIMSLLDVQRSGPSNLTSLTRTLASVFGKSREYEGPVLRAILKGTRAFDMLNGHWKRMVLAGRPAYHLLNITTDTTQMALLGINRPIRQMRTAVAHAQGKTEQGRKLAMEFSDWGFDVEELVQDGMVRRFLGPLFPGAGSSSRLTAGGMQLDIDRNVSMRELSEGLANPFSARDPTTYPGALARGARSAYRGTVRAATFDGERIARAWDVMSKFAVYSHARTKLGMGPAEAIRFVQKGMIDYELQSALLKTMRPFVPFMTWLVRAPAATARSFASNPGRTQLALRAQGAAMGGGDTSEPPPDYLQSRLTYDASDPLRQVFGASRQLLGGTPLEDAENLYAVGRNVPLVEAFEPGLRTIAGARPTGFGLQVGPVPSMMIEGLTNRSLVTGRELTPPNAMGFFPAGTPNPFSSVTPSWAPNLRADVPDANTLTSRRFIPALLGSTLTLGANMALQSRAAEEGMTTQSTFLGETRQTGLSHPQDVFAGQIMNLIFANPMYATEPGRTLLDATYSPEMRLMKQSPKLIEQDLEMRLDTEALNRMKGQQITP